MASNDGQIMRVTPCPTRTVPYVLKGCLNPNGYLRVKLSRSGHKKSELAHRLVLEAFVGPAPMDRPWGCHRDDNKLNNAIDNLYWGTAINNHDDRRRNGRSFDGHRNGRAKLTWKLVRQIRDEFDGQYGAYSRLSRKFGVAHTQIMEIIKMESWRAQA